MGGAMEKRVMLGIALVCLTGSAFAINKCTGKDGKVTYQEAPCEGAVNAQQIKVPLSAEELAKRWEFSRQRDSMTGRAMCFAVSPQVLVRASRSYEFIRLQLAVAPGLMSLTVRTREGSSTIFHNNIAGLGIKVGEGAFVPLSVKISQHALGFGEGDMPPVLGSLKNAKSFRVRVRFWPWDEHADSEDGSLEGVLPAVQAALKCGI